MSVLWDILLMGIERAFGSLKDFSRGKKRGEGDEPEVENDSPGGLETGTQKETQDQQEGATEAKSDVG